MNRVRDFRGHGLMEWDRASVALDCMVVTLALHLLTLDLFAFTLFPLTVGHFVLALALQDLAFSRVPFALPVQCLRRRMLHSLSDAGKRVAGTVRRPRRVLSIRRRLVSSVTLAEFCQPGEGVSARLTGGVVRTFSGKDRLVCVPKCINPKKRWYGVGQAWEKC